jgi:inhibitor of KinA sporulation pathway (predicted exonuclease)
MSKHRKYEDNCILVVDIESTCWDDKNAPENGAIVVDPVSEIIEIGYAVLDYKINEIKESGSIVVRPIESIVSPFCQRLTGWTQEQVDRGITFEEACKTLQGGLKAGSRLWASYGNYDLDMFRKQCERRNVKYPFVPQHLNIKALSTVINGEVNGLGRTLSLLGLQFEGKQHSGKDDAFNTARILQYYKAKFGEKILI